MKLYQEDLEKEKLLSKKEKLRYQFRVALQ